MVAAPMRRAAALAAAFAIAASVAAARADEPPPLSQGALARGFALPNLGRPALLAPGSRHLGLDLTDVNEFADKSNAQESLLADGEAAQLSLDYRRGLADGWEAGVFVPALIQGGGFLDSVIEGWHKVWGMPNGGRENFRKNRYRFEYVRNGQVLLDVSQPSAGIGDLQLGLGRRLAPNLALRGMLQLPTGDASHLGGNGAFSGALWLDGALPLNFLKGLSLQASGGLSYTGGGQVLPQLQKHLLPLGALGLEYQFAARWSAGLQIYFHDAPYRDTGLAPLTRVAAPLSARLSYRAGPRTTFHFGFQEKASVLASPDFGIFMGAAFD
ncbi:MAG: DUF3187 family protein [Nevskia sp.]|nr:DUF3187 family protein [Nevskia sp.]